MRGAGQRLSPGKGGNANTRRRRPEGTARDTRRPNRSQTNKCLTSGARGKNFSPIRNKQEFFPKTLAEDNAADSFAVVLADFTDGEIATAGGVSKETAKKYRQGKAMPRSVPLLKMAAHPLPGVWEWILHTQGDAHPESAKSIDALLRAALKQVERGA